MTWVEHTGGLIRKRSGSISHRVKGHKANKEPRRSLKARRKRKRK